LPSQSKSGSEKLLGKSIDFHLFGA
jgi:hypothetical protein